MTQTTDSMNQALVLVRSQLGFFEKKKVTVDSRLFHDLGIDGDDAVELMMALSEEYSVNVDAFIFRNYFGPELGAGWRHMSWRLFHKNDDGGIKPLTVRDLAWAIENQKMIGPVERQQMARQDPSNDVNSADTSARCCGQREMSLHQAMRKSVERTVIVMCIGLLLLAVGAAMVRLRTNLLSFVLLLTGMLVTLLSVMLFFFAVRCPRCRRPIVWMAGMVPGKSKQNFLQITECPNCGHSLTNERKKL